MTVSFEATREEHKLVRMIVERFERSPGAIGKKFDRLESTMDLVACNVNGTPLDLVKLVTSGDVDFAHDFWGIQRHLDRETGKLTGGFRPRCAK